jgi:hypothetical protein
VLVSYHHSDGLPWTLLLDNWQYCSKEIAHVELPGGLNAGEDSFGHCRAILIEKGAIKKRPGLGALG